MPDLQRDWNPLKPAEILAIFAGAPFPWCIAGGYAIEFAAGRVLRDHADIDVLVLKRDANTVRQHFQDWDCWVADPPGNLRPWALGDELPGSAHDVWCRRGARDNWRFQLMFDDSDGVNWKSRRNENVKCPISELTRTDGSGILYLAPEVQLFYKAKNPRPKDEIDFEAVLPLLRTSERNWLEAAIRKTYGNENPWLNLLA